MKGENTENQLFLKTEMGAFLSEIKPSPPFGDQMPLMTKKKLTNEEIEIFKRWIDQGRKKTKDFSNTRHYILPPKRQGHREVRSNKKGSGNIPKPFCLYSRSRRINSTLQELRKLNHHDSMLYRLPRATLFYFQHDEADIVVLRSSVRPLLAGF